MPAQTGNLLGDTDPFLGGLMGQHGATHNVTDSIDLLNTGSALLVHDDKAVIVQFQPGVIQAKMFSIRLTADRHD